MRRVSSENIEGKESIRHNTGNWQVRDAAMGEIRNKQQLNQEEKLPRKLQKLLSIAKKINIKCSQLTKRDTDWLTIFKRINKNSFVSKSFSYW